MSHVISTPEELDALPVGSVVRSSAGTIAARHDASTPKHTPCPLSFPWDHLALPATVLFRPDAPTPTAAPQRSFPPDPLVDVLIEHQRTGAAACRCGPRPLGSSFAEHVAAQIRAAGLSS